jgi:hypothetical protein
VVYLWFDRFAPRKRPTQAAQGEPGLDGQPEPAE